MKTSSIHRAGSQATLALALCLLLAPMALAQTGVGARDVRGRGGEASSASTEEAEPVRPPAPTPPKKPNRLIPYGILFVAGAVTLGVGLIPSKRTHQD
ncbi:MAG: hypothetical protein KDA21_03870 [Phycisphaerales bacterium]|nr:hypothetical protein [Phycisphaerales bacterium]